MCSFNIYTKVPYILYDFVDKFYLLQFSHPVSKFLLSIAVILKVYIYKHRLYYSLASYQKSFGAGGGVLYSYLFHFLFFILSYFIWFSSLDFSPLLSLFFSPFLAFVFIFFPFFLAISFSSFNSNNNCNLTK